MKCTRVEKFLALHVAGDLTGRRARRAVTEHLTMCAACRHHAAGYDASRKLLRAGADSLPAEFDSAFYEEIRNSVLAQIKRGRTPAAPPPLAALSSFFNGRFAYAASLALVVIAASLSWHSYTRRTAVDGTPQEVIANANHNLPVTPRATATPKRVPATISHRQTSGASDELAEGTTGEATREAKSSFAKRHPRIERSQSGARAPLMLTSNKPSNVGRNLLAPNTTGTRQATNPSELATGGDGTRALAEVSRIEIQTSDPNIRIIWLAPGTDSTQPLK